MALGSWHTHSTDPIADEYTGSNREAVRSRQLAHAHARAPGKTEPHRRFTRGTDLETPGETHRFEVVRYHLVAPVQTRQEGLQPLLDEVDREKRPFSTRKLHMRRGVSVNG